MDARRVKGDPCLGVNGSCMAPAIKIGGCWRLQQRLDNDHALTIPGGSWTYNPKLLFTTNWSYTNLLDILLVYRFLIGIIQPFIFTYFIGYLIGIQNSKHITV